MTGHPTREPNLGNYTRLPEFKAVVNISIEAEPILLIQKRGVERTGVNVFVDF